jgi:hypothetical protein
MTPQESVLIISESDGTALWYAPIPGPGNLIASRTKPGVPAGADTFGNAYPAGTWLREGISPELLGSLPT